MKNSDLKPGDIVKLIGSEKGYKDTYSIIDTFTNDKDNGDDIVLVAWQDPHTHVVRTQVLSPQILDSVKEDNQ